MREINVVVLGAGQIGQAIVQLCEKLQATLPDVVLRVHSWDIDLTKTRGNFGAAVDFDTIDTVALADRLRLVKALFVFNALPFNLNERVAHATASAGASYFDFTEDDVMADKVQKIYAQHPYRFCAVKCGLAPGFINYIGHSLARKIDTPKSLMISVGALPRHVNVTNLRDNYNLSWSVDGLVNEYIRPCRVRINGVTQDISALTGLEQVIADGIQYDAAYTSGGVGSLIRELKIPNIAYKTLRYPGHYTYVKEVCKRHNNQFEPIKQEFLKVFPYNKNDVIAVYAECKGVMTDGAYHRETYAGHFVGADGLSAIQTTTAGSGVAVFEMILTGKLAPGIINHADISLDAFTSTGMFKHAYIKQTT